MIESISTTTSTTTPPKKRTGRPRKVILSDKEALAAKLKKIWESDTAKASEKVAASSLYSELMGYKQRPQEAINDAVGRVIAIKFIEDAPRKNSRLNRLALDVDDKNATHHDTTPDTTPLQETQEGLLDGAVDGAVAKGDEGAKEIVKENEKNENVKLKNDLNLPAPTPLQECSNDDDKKGVLSHSQILAFSKNSDKNEDIANDFDGFGDFDTPNNSLDTSLDASLDAK
jgi:hypothetical protein